MSNIFIHIIMMMKRMCGVHNVAWVLLVVGGVNWGLVGLLDFNLVSYLLGAWPIAEKAVYVLVGLSAIAMLGIGKCCGKCDDKDCAHCLPMAKPGMPMGGEKKM